MRGVWSWRGALLGGEYPRVDLGSSRESRQKKKLTGGKDARASVESRKLMLEEEKKKKRKKSFSFNGD